MRIKTTIRDASMEMPPVLAVGEWNTVYVQYILTVGGCGVSKVAINGADAGLQAYTSSFTAPPPFSGSDKVRIGGFTGHLRRFQIYSPSAFPFETTSGSSIT